MTAESLEYFPLYNLISSCFPPPFFAHNQPQFDSMAPEKRKSLTLMICYFDMLTSNETDTVGERKEDKSDRGSD